VTKLLGGFTLAIIVVVPGFAWGQDAPLAPGWDLTLTLYGSLATIITGAVTWGVLRLASWLKLKVKNELVFATIWRFANSVGNAVKLINQTLKRQIEAAKAPGSPGGQHITSEEARQLRNGVWEALKHEYGSVEGIGRFLAPLELKDSTALTSFVDTQIEAAVHDTGKAASSPQKPTG